MFRAAVVLAIIGVASALVTKITDDAKQSPEMNPMVFRGIIAMLVLIAAIATFMAFRNKSTAEPARKRFLPTSVLEKVSEMAETNSSGDDVDKLNKALGDRMQKLSAKLS